MSRCRRLSGLAALTIALSVTACDRTVELASPVGEGIERAGLHLETASILDMAPVTREGAALATRQAIDLNGYDAQITTITLVTVTGPGNPRLGWDPRDDRLVYAVEWTGDRIVGLTLVSGRTGEVLLLTAY